LNIVNSDDHAITQAKVWQLVKDYNGTITAEHGVGLLRRDSLQSMEAKARLQAMQNLKRVFDPNGILNPGKLC
jgi:FAD/FMN-containing dehydrogenase